MTEFAYKIVGSVVLREKELSELMRLSDGRVVACDFGTGGVRLKHQQSAWAIPLLVGMRGLTPDGTGGILIWGASE